jgi:hypothetical protein
MNYRKLDTRLAAALDEMKNPEEPALAVFIHMAQAPDSSAATFLKDIGVKLTSSRQQIVTARVSPRDVEELSKQPWVRQVKLSQKIRMLNQK